MIGIIAAMGREIERDRKALLAGREIAPIERVGVLGRGEPGILAHGPRLRDVHGRVGAAQVGRDAGISVEEIEAGAVIRTVDRLDRNAFGREPGACGRPTLRHRGLGKLDP